MRIVERYPASFSIFTGRGVGIVLLPLRAVCAFFYWLWVSLAGRMARAGAAAAAARSEGRGRGGAAVVSIGNLEVGGTGKTPCVMAIASAIIDRGGRVAVVTRGYKGEAGRNDPFVVPAGRACEEYAGISYTAEEAYLDARGGSNAIPSMERLVEIIGDEAALYRRRRIPVVIDARRARGIEVARRLFAPTHILLDDAFRQRSIHKDLDILLLDAADPLRGGMLLPLGRLREPPSAIRRADAVIFTRAGGGEVSRSVESYVEGMPVRFARHRPIDLADRSGGTLPLSYLDGRCVNCFSGIARPGSFEEDVQSLGAEIDVSFRFMDHHSYRRRDVAAMIAQGSAAPFVTTEKDWVKVSHLFPENVELYALRMAMEIDGIDGLLALVHRR